MKALFVFLLIMTSLVSASDDIDDALDVLGPGSEQSEPENTSIAETETKIAEEAREKTKRGFAWLGVGLAGSGTALVIGAETITGNNLIFSTLEATTYGGGLGMIASGCAVVWKALPSKKSKK